MSIRPAIVIAACLAFGPAASGGVFKNIGREVGAGAVEKIQPALVATLADAEARATRLEDHAGVVAGGLIEQVNAKGQERLEQVNRILEARMLQAQVEAKDLTDHALSGVGELVNNSLVTAKETAKDLIKDLQATTSTALQKASDVLKDRIADVGREVNSAVEKADRTLAERIAQVDETVGRRLGNVDVIASKQRVAIEETAVRIAVLIGLVVFTVFVLRRLYGRYSKLIGEATGLDDKKSGGKHGSRSPDGRPAADRWGPRGGERTLMLVRGLGIPLIGNLIVAALGAGVLLVLYDRLPLGARAEATELVRVHRDGFADSLKRFDFARARFHASQLEYLAPEDPVVHGALIAKAELLRDVFARPTLLGTDAGIAGLWKRLDEARRILGPQPDPDMLVVEAMLLWQTGDSRRDELRAASLCARALRVRPIAGGFALAPLARAYIETFVDAPYTDDRVGLGRDSYTLDDLQAVLDYAPAVDPAHPLAARIQILRLMRTVDGKSSTAYADTIQAHLEVLAAARGRNAKTQDIARQKRTDAAKKVLDAWTTFDAALAAAPDLARDPSVLLVFRLNDAQYARAKWFVDNPSTESVAPFLVARAEAPAKVPRSATAKERLQLAPPRLVWARRYQLVIDGPARSLFELQESNRFAALESAAYAFEQAMIDVETAQAAAHGAAAPDLARSRAAQAAAALGLYVSDPKAMSPRTPFAARLMPPRLKERDAAEYMSLEQAMLGRGIRLL